MNTPVENEGTGFVEASRWVLIGGRPPLNQNARLIQAQQRRFNRVRAVWIALALMLIVPSAVAAYAYLLWSLFLSGAP